MEGTGKIDSYIKLNNGMNMPKVGLGTANIPNISPIVYQSIKDGVRLIDTARSYKNEKEVGEAIKKAIDEGIVNREDLFIITKVWPTHKRKVEESLRESLADLGLEYVDLFLDHWPFYDYSNKEAIIEPIPLHQQWAAMEELVNKGLTRSIGVSNYKVQLLADLLSYAKVKPVVNEFEYHPYLQQKELVKYCQSQGVQVIAYNSICRGAYALRDLKQELNLLEDPEFKKFADKYGVTPGIFALNWALSQDIVVIPGTHNPNRMKVNLKALNFKICEGDLDEMQKLNKDHRFCLFFTWTNGVDIFA
jgi:D-xylose reductase